MKTMFIFFQDQFKRAEKNLERKFTEKSAIEKNLERKLREQLAVEKKEMIENNNALKKNLERKIREQFAVEKKMIEENNALRKKIAEIEQKIDSLITFKDHSEPLIDKWELQDALINVSETPQKEFDNLQ